jgi:exodeoxyribonuclease VII large subunit
MNNNIPEFSVSEFSRSIKRIVEDNFGYVRIKGEISNFKKASSGHLYFNLKDELAILNAVCFRQTASLVSFDAEDGIEVIASGKISIYEGRSNYQIIVEKLEIAGIGTILATIEKRRLRLLQEGYFDQKHKKLLPFLPKKIAVITSPSGAVIEDIINRINLRHPTHLIVYPALMQGKNCAREVIDGIKYFNQIDKEQKPNLIIIARGGGSFEDLLSFNDENLVIEVFNSAIPIISAIGHETDTTLIDYAADLRAPTPTAAAEMAMPVLKDLQNLLGNFGKRLTNYCRTLFDQKQKNLVSLNSSVINLQEKLINFEQKFFYLFLNFEQSIVNNLENKKQLTKILSSKISQPQNLYQICQAEQNRLQFLAKNLQNNCQNSSINYYNKVNQLSRLLVSYDYKNVLKRGYAVIRLEDKIINKKENISSRQIVNIEMVDGRFNTIVID